MSHRHLLSIMVTALLAGTVACSSGNEAGASSDSEQSDLVDEPNDHSPKGSATPDEDGQPSATETDDICPGNASYDFELKGIDLQAWEGRNIGVVAQEYKDSKRKIAVRLNGKIQSGNATLSCDKSLSETYGGARVAVYVDVNGDGKCTPDVDVGADSLYYGWISDVRVSAFDPNVTPVEVAPNTAYLTPIVGSPPPRSGIDPNFCSFFN